MNYPMLYWFVPRELVGLVKFLLLALVVSGLLWLVLSMFRSATDAAARKRRLVWFLGLVVVPVGGLLLGNDVMERRQVAERKAYMKAAWEHFKQRCETAHVSYFKAVPPQDGVFIMKPGQSATAVQLSDQFWMGDPYDLPDTPENEARQLLYRQTSLPKGSWDERHGRGGFDFVEAPYPGQPGKFLRFTLKPKGEKDGQGYEIHQPGTDVTDTRRSRYGYTWDDISTPEDRRYWVAGGRMRVVDLETGEVVAERVGYVIEKYFGATSSTFNQTPWSNTRGAGTTCPEIRTLRIFLSTALGNWNELTKDGQGK